MAKLRLGYLVPIALGLNLGILINTFVASRVVVEGVSMKPMYKNGDVLLINKLSKAERGDIITFNRNGKYLIKRVIGMPGDTVSIANSKVSVNGKVLKEDYINEKTFDGGNLEGMEIKLSDEEYFVMGDNRNESMDSRHFGVVKEDSIFGIKMLDLRKG